METTADWMQTRWERSEVLDRDRATAPPLVFGQLECRRGGPRPRLEALCAIKRPGYSAEDQHILETQVRGLREGGIDVPSGKTTLRPIYLEHFRLGALIAQVEFLMPMKKTAKILKMSKASMGSDSASTMEAGASKYGFWVESYMDFLLCSHDL